MNVELDGESLTINKLVSVARNDSLVKITDKSWKRIENCRNMLQSKIDSHEIMYGITTGIGEFSLDDLFFVQGLLADMDHTWGAS